MSREATGGSGGNLRLRVVSALVLGIAVLIVTVLGGFAFRLFAAVLAALVFHEWTAMRVQTRRIDAIVARAALAAVLAVMLAGLTTPVWFAVAAIAVLVVLLSGGGAWNAAGLAYAGVPALALAELRGADHPGLNAILFLYAVVWATDILAYFAGRAFGGPKLAPSISPGKTWSGAIGGSLGGVAAGAAAAWFLEGMPAESPVILLALLLSIVAQAGDLFESAIKRRHGAKDSGALIPGHGGVMDRVDGLVAAAVVLYLVGMSVPGLVAPAG